jgi:hypothetical protein
MALLKAIQSLSFLGARAIESLMDATHQKAIKKSDKHRFVRLFHEFRS